MELGVLSSAFSENRYDRCLVSVTPSGILPFGHSLGLRGRWLGPADLGWQQQAAPGDVVAKFDVATAPDHRIDDGLRRRTSTTRGTRTPDPEAIGVDRVLADWDRGNTNYLLVGLRVLGRR
jgi:hypothetical protein